MSQVFSFRIDENNPREAQARQVIEDWASKGYTLRHVMIEALLTYADKEARQDDLSSALEQIITMLKGLSVETGLRNDQQNEEMRLTKPFMDAISKATRPGLRLE